MYLLDTNACIAVLNGTSPVLAGRMRQCDPPAVVVCSVVKAELLYGARRSARVAQNLDLLKRFFEPLTCLPFDDACAEHYGTIRADLEAQGVPIGGNDLLIAATARAHDATLVTRNSREFGRVAGLRHEDWEGSDAG
ncbi:MAG: type II toxin-antitoxin system VapC family toxin [Gemmatimonadota bacterium]